MIDIGSQDVDLKEKEIGNKKERKRKRNRNRNRNIKNFPLLIIIGGIYSKLKEESINQQ